MGSDGAVLVAEAWRRGARQRQAGEDVWREALIERDRLDSLNSVSGDPVGGTRYDPDGRPVASSHVSSAVVTVGLHSARRRPVGEPRRLLT